MAYDPLLAVYVSPKFQAHLSAFSQPFVSNHAFKLGVCDGFLKLVGDDTGHTIRARIVVRAYFLLQACIWAAIPIADKGIIMIF